MTAALRREAAAAAEAKRQARAVDLLQGALAERETDLQRFRMIIKLKEGMISRLEVRNVAPPMYNTHSTCISSGIVA